MKKIFIFSILLFMLLFTLLICAIGYENRQTIIEVKNLCNKVEISKKLDRDILKNLYLNINEYEIQNQNYGKVGGSKSISCDIEVRNEIVISKTLSVR